MEAHCLHLKPEAGQAAQRSSFGYQLRRNHCCKQTGITLQGFPPIATNPLGNTTISVAIGGYYCTETVIWLQFVCLMQHKI
jgi:hypothetical protein